MIHHNVCPVCSNPEISHFLSCTDHFLSKEVFEIVRCEKCGFRFTQDHPEESDAGRYYESDEYISHSDSKKGITDKTYQLIRKIMLYRKTKMIRKITGLSTGSVLDIGSGTGHFLRSMKQSGWNTLGVELNEKARIYSELHFNIETISSDKIKTLPASIFDCITLWHVLEHFQEPFKIAEEISRLLKPEGVCIIALPNSSSLDSDYYGNEWAAYDVPRHLWHFNPDTFSLFSVRNNFSVQKTLTLPFDVFYISILSEKYAGRKFHFLYGIFNGLKFFLRCFFNRTGSSSMMYILRKSTC
jgi:SAM-dependent methyltransferase